MTRTKNCPRTRLRIGARVVSRENGLDDGAVRVVVGHKADGRCMTIYEAPLPWMNGRIYLEEEHDLVELESSLGLVAAAV